LNIEFEVPFSVDAGGLGWRVPGRFKAKQVITQHPHRPLKLKQSSNKLWKHVCPEFDLHFSR
jgi:hypothetical protein